MTSMRVTIDLEACIMAGECVYNHPDRFAWGDDDQPVVVEAEIADAEARRAVEQAIAVCPSGAIAIVD